MGLVEVARETLTIIERGTYDGPAGASVDLRRWIDAAVRGSVLYTPDQLERLVATLPPQPPFGRRVHIEVTPESTVAAARRLTQVEGVERVAALNFASARHPGGGWLRGARAQEEDLARCSALYPCLLANPGYYEANRAHRSFLYTDHIIYAPDVPFFRDDRLDLLAAPFRASIITAPAPNAGEHRRREPGAGRQRHRSLTARAGKVLAVAARHGHAALVLGAWGCGVFRNDPRTVAEVFGSWLDGPAFAQAFARVVFAVYDRSPGQATLRAFRERFGGT